MTTFYPSAFWFFIKKKCSIFHCQIFLLSHIYFVYFERKSTFQRISFKFYTWIFKSLSLNIQSAFSLSLHLGYSMCCWKRIYFKEKSESNFFFFSEDTENRICCKTWFYWQVDYTHYLVKETPSPLKYSDNSKPRYFL